MSKKLELGHIYNLAGYKWVPVRIDEDLKFAVMQSLGVTKGPWPGYSMLRFGNGDYYSENIAGEDISSYNKDTENLIEKIRSVVINTACEHGLYLSSLSSCKNINLKDILIKAASSYKSFGISNPILWLSTLSLIHI